MEKPEIKTDEDQKYFDYIIKHIDNVKASFKANGRKISVALALSEDEHELLKQNVEHHDESKFSKEEFHPYRQFFYTRANETKDRVIFADAWIHHFRNNKHHPEYWVQDGTTKEMPKIYIAEMILDWEAMSRNFGGNPLKWYLDNTDKMPFNETTRRIVEFVLPRVYHIDDNLQLK